MKTIRIFLDFDTHGFLSITSPDIQGLYLQSTDHDSVMRDVLPAIKGLQEFNKGDPQ